MRSITAFSGFMVLVMSALTMSASVPQGSGGGGGLPPAERKTCDFGNVGDEGCTVKVEMKTSPNSPCTDGSTEYCVTIKVSCPPDIPPGDPGEECESNDCEVCGSAGGFHPVSVVCDGQTFTAKPSEGKTWSDVMKDCGNATVTSS